MVTFRQLRFVAYIGLCWAGAKYYYKEVAELKNPEARKRAYYTQLKGEGIYTPFDQGLKNRVLDEEDKEALRKYAA